MIKGVRIFFTKCVRSDIIGRGAHDLGPLEHMDRRLEFISNKCQYDIDSLWKILHENKFGTSNVYEIGETGVGAVKAPDKIIAPEGKKQAP
jgi:hypothetical protein